MSLENTTINVSNNCIPSKGVVVLADTLSTCVSLRQLNISNNLLLQDGAVALTKNTVIANLDV